VNDIRFGQPDVSWTLTLVGDRLVVGPSHAFDHGAPDSVEVEVLSVEQAESASTLGEHLRSIPVAESGVRSFTVDWYRDSADERTVAVNPAGGNRVSWNDARTRFWLTPAADSQLTAVHLRFVLRHLTTDAITAETGGRSVHAVTAALSTGRSLAVAGRTRAGKTRLMNRLLLAGLVSEIVDDDCPVIAAGGLAHTLVPRRHEVAAATTAHLAGLVLLADIDEVTVVDGAFAREFLAATPKAWPAPWLPAADQNEMAELPADLPVVAVPISYGDVAGATAVMRHAQQLGWLR
jgi:hypothetical protein